MITGRINQFTWAKGGPVHTAPTYLGKYLQCKRRRQRLQMVAPGHPMFRFCAQLGVPNRGRVCRRWAVFRRTTTHTHTHPPGFDRMSAPDVLASACRVQERAAQSLCTCVKGGSIPRRLLYEKMPAAEVGAVSPAPVYESALLPCHPLVRGPADDTSPQAWVYREVISLFRAYYHLLIYIANRFSSNPRSTARNLAKTTKKRSFPTA